MEHYLRDSEYWEFGVRGRLVIDFKETCLFELTQISYVQMQAAKRSQTPFPSQGGKDHASARYIYTRLSPITRFMFPNDDDILLDYLNEDGQSIEPIWWIL
ncbi:hypothetical protein ACSBR1_007869 [Camellia fascicularis]